MTKNRNDLVARLRDKDELTESDICDEAADEIERQQLALERIAAAVEAFYAEGQFNYDEDRLFTEINAALAQDVAQKVAQSK